MDAPVRPLIAPPRRRRRVPPVVPLAAGLVLVLAGCSPTAVPAPADRGAGTAGSAAVPPGTPAGDAVPQDTDPERALGLRASLRQYRSDVAAGQVQVTVDNTGTGAVRVGAVRLDSPAFVPLPPTPEDTRLSAGRRVDLPVPHGEPRCSSTSTPGTHRAVARLVVRDGTTRAVVLPLAGADDLLRRLHRAQCEDRALRRAVAVEFAPEWSVVTGPAPAALGRLRVQRRDGQETVVLHGLSGNVIFTVRAPGAAERPLLTLQPDEVEESLVVEVRASRCDPHALIESGRTFEFPVQVTLGERGPQVVVVRLEDQGRAVLDRLLGDTCRPTTP